MNNPFTPITDFVEIVRNGPVGEPGQFGRYEGEEELPENPYPIFNPESEALLESAGYRYRSLMDLSEEDVDCLLKEIERSSLYDGRTLKVDGKTREGFKRTLKYGREGDCFTIETNESITAGIVLTTQDPDSRVNGGPSEIRFVDCLVIDPAFRGDIRIFVGLVAQIISRCVIEKEGGQIIESSSRESTIMRLLRSAYGSRVLATLGYEMVSARRDSDNSETMGELMWNVRLKPIKKIS